MSQEEPLEYHYMLLGLRPGANKKLVQAAYKKLCIRCDPRRFPIGSQEAQSARLIRRRLNASFHALGGVPYDEWGEEAATLLRGACAPPSAPEELLRPAETVTHTPGEELLRAHQHVDSSERERRQ